MRMLLFMCYSGYKSILKWSRRVNLIKYSTPINVYVIQTHERTMEMIVEINFKNLFNSNKKKTCPLFQVDHIHVYFMTIRMCASRFLTSFDFFILSKYSNQCRKMERKRKNKQLNKKPSESSE